jgi:hypothetical protein
MKVRRQERASTGDDSDIKPEQHTSERCYSCQAQQIPEVKLRYAQFTIPSLTTINMSPDCVAELA